MLAHAMQAGGSRARPRTSCIVDAYCCRQSAASPPRVKGFVDNVDDCRVANGGLPPTTGDDGGAALPTPPRTQQLSGFSRAGGLEVAGGRQRQPCRRIRRPNPPVRGVHDKARAMPATVEGSEPGSPFTSSDAAARSRRRPPVPKEGRGDCRRHVGEGAVRDSGANEIVKCARSKGMRLELRVSVSPLAMQGIRY